jgi:DNA repair protein RadC
MQYYSNIPIKHWAVEDRPREKMMQRGAESLTDAELIAILLSTGTRERSAIDLGRDILEQVGGLDRLGRSSVAELTRIRGIGKAKAITLVSAFELARRRLASEAQAVKISSSQRAADYLRARIGDLDQEVFYVLFLNQNNEVKGEKRISLGGVSATVIDPRLVFREAVGQLASALIVAHNHPSGNLQPSDADLSITRKLSEGAKLFDMRILDHLIITMRGHYSFADQGLLA